MGTYHDYGFGIFINSTSTHVNTTWRILTYLSLLRIRLFVFSSEGLVFERLAIFKHIFADLFMIFKRCFLLYVDNFYLLIQCYAQAKIHIVRSGICVQIQYQNYLKEMFICALLQNSTRKLEFQLSWVIFQFFLLVELSSITMQQMNDQFVYLSWDSSKGITICTMDKKTKNVRSL